MRFAFLARIREGLIPDRPGHQVVPDSVTGTYAGWDDDRATYTLQWGPAAGGLFYGWSMADEADTAIEALEAIRADDERLTDPAFLGVAIEHTHQLRERLDAIEEELLRRARAAGENGGPALSWRELGSRTGQHHTTISGRLKRSDAGQHAARRDWLLQDRDSTQPDPLMIRLDLTDEGA
jgi:hypothetical protein